MSRIDLTGKTFGNLKVVERSDKTHPAYGRLWKCACKCGAVTYVPTNRLTTLNTTSCGCLRYKAHEVAVYEPKKDCIMFRDGTEPHCDALMEMFCKTRGKCSFYKAGGNA